MKWAVFVALLAFIIPLGVSAQSFSCVKNGYTVVFVNGIFGDREKAKADKEKLRYFVGEYFIDEPIFFQVGYNPSHLAGLADVGQATAQMFNGSISSYDLHTILLQIHPEVTTRKLILVGHSQGAFYSNEMYEYLVKNGEPKEALSVYNVGSPASYTAGGGKYLNSSRDALLDFLRLSNFSILPSNVDILVDTSPNGWDGHGFSDTYLAGAADRVVSDLHSQMQALVPTFSSDKESCFTPPDRSLGYQTQAVLLRVADPTAVALKTGGSLALQGARHVAGGAAWLAQGVAEFIADSIKVTASPRDPVEDYTKTFEVAKKLYGSSLSKEDYRELLTESQGSAVVLAAAKLATEDVQGAVLGTSTGPVTPTPEEKPFIPAPSGPTQEYLARPAQAPEEVASTTATTTSMELVSGDEQIPAEEAATTDIAATASTTQEIATSTPEVLPEPDPEPQPELEPVIPPTPAAGFYCEGDPGILVPTDVPPAYTPQGALCTFVSEFTGTKPDYEFHFTYTGLYKGVVGSSTPVSTFSYPGSQHSYTVNFGSTPWVGEYFVPIFHTYERGYGYYNGFMVADMISYFEKGTRRNGNPTPPPVEYKVIPFIGVAGEPQ